MKQDDSRFENDPRLTAFALGELEGAEREEIEKLIAEHPRARAIVDEMRELGELVATKLATETTPGLTEKQHQRIERAAKGTPVAAAPTSRFHLLHSPWVRVASVIASAAAVVAILDVTGVLDWGVEQASEHRVARSGEARSSSVFRASSEPQALHALQSLGYIGESEEEPVAEDVVVRAKIQEPPGSAGLASLGYGGSEFRADFLGPRIDQLSLLDGYSNLEFARIPFDFGEDQRGQNPNTESYDPIHENPFVAVSADPRSTFSIDVDTASYANMRRFLREGRLPPRDAVRIEEFINYFRYDYPEPDGEHPFATHVEVAAAPWAPEHRLVRIGIKGREAIRDEPRARNLVFLLDVSGSMNQRDKLPLLQQSMQLLVEQLDEDDHISIVVYAGNSGLVLPTTSGDCKRTILDAIDRLEAGGSTNGGSGIQLAYQQAREGFFPGGVNRVILATDGDFNVGITDRNDLIGLIEREAKSNVFLSVLGFGRGNLKDSQMEQLADKGNGNYSYIDSLSEARKVLVHEMEGTLETIAKDVKIQIEFNPQNVAAWRLIGYENRVLAHRDFDDDAKDAGEIGAGHTVTALYEVIPQGVAIAGGGELRYQQPQVMPTDLTDVAHSDELMLLRLRYKDPEGQTSRLIETTVPDRERSAAEASDDFRFAAAVASFGMLLRGSRHAGDAKLERVRTLAAPGARDDRHGYRQEFLRLIDLAIQIGGSNRLGGR
jgi:Ca-activated chloride channel homolog